MFLPGASRKFLDESFGRMKRDLRELISIPSVTGDRVQTERAVDILLKQGNRLGLRTEKILGGRMGIIETGEGPETIGILTHVDVVPPGPAALWSFGPYEGTEDGGWLYGRGSVDMKGPTIASLYAMSAAATGAHPRKRMRMIVGTQEEGVWEDMEAYCRSYPLPDYGFTPDGEFPVTNREKGYADVHIQFPRENGEEGDTRRSLVLSLHGGESVNTIPEACQAVLLDPDGALSARIEAARAAEPAAPGIWIGSVKDRDRVILSITGKATHSSNPENGANAVSAMAALLARVLPADDPSFPLCRFIALNFHGDTSGKALGLSGLPAPPENEDFGQTAVSPTLLRTTSEGFELVVNLRTAYGTTRTLIHERFSGCAERYGFSFGIFNYQDPLLVDRARPFMRILNESYSEISGFPGGFILANGTSYAKAMPGIVCWGPLFPGEEDRCHEVDERIKLDNFKLASLIYGDALYRIACSQASCK